MPRKGTKGKRFCDRPITEIFKNDSEKIREEYEYHPLVTVTAERNETLSGFKINVNGYGRAHIMDDLF